MEHEDHWKQIVTTYLEPLRAEVTERPIQEIMRKIRAHSPDHSPVLWPIFARWAIPALALSATSFAAVLAYTTRPPALSTDVLFLEDAKPDYSTDGIHDAFNEDPLFGITGEER